MARLCRWASCQQVALKRTTLTNFGGELFLCAEHRLVKLSHAWQDLVYYHS